MGNWTIWKYCAGLLLEAGALPSVPASEDRLTALHEAVTAGRIEEVGEAVGTRVVASCPKRLLVFSYHYCVA